MKKLLLSTLTLVMLAGVSQPVQAAAGAWFAVGAVAGILGIKVIQCSQCGCNPCCCNK